MAINLNAATRRYTATTDYVHQVAREARTKFSKPTCLFSIGAEIRRIVADWVTYHRREKLWDNDDPRFARCRIGLVRSITPRKILASPREAGGARNFNGLSLHTWVKNLADNKGVFGIFANPKPRLLRA